MFTPGEKSRSILKSGQLLGILLLVVALVWIGFRILLPNRSTIFAGVAPANLGVDSGKLAPCPDSPNCVSSQSEDAQHRVEPIKYNSTPREAIANLERVIKNQDRAKIAAETDNYIYAEFTSPWLGFVDDVEFYLNDETGIIEVRSASRLGESDLGVNRQRVEKIRNQFARA